MHIRRFQEQDANEVSALIGQALRETNIKDYTLELMEETAKWLSPEALVKRSHFMHSYVVEWDGNLVGCGSIGAYWGKPDESSLFTIFVRPDFQGKGVGRLIMKTLEQDELFLRAKRIEIPSSITACEFYRKFGYDFKDGNPSLDEEQYYRLEKFR